MSHLVNDTTNKTLDLVKQCFDDSQPLPSDSAMAKYFGVSRTTVRTVVDRLCELGILAREKGVKSVIRRPKKNDYLSIVDNQDSKEKQFERYFLNLIQTGKLQPGDKFSELSLAKQSDCITITVREYLIRFSRTGLIRKTPRAHWQMVEFDENFANELISFRKVLEVHSVKALLKRPDHDPVWGKLAKSLNMHRELLENIDDRYNDFPKIDSELHALLQDCSGNRFVDQFYEIITFVCHYHYQWDRSDEKERNAVAAKEHIELIENLLARDIHGSIVSLERHLDTAHATLLKSAHGLELT